MDVYVHEFESARAEAQIMAWRITHDPADSVLAVAVRDERREVVREHVRARVSGIALTSAAAVTGTEVAGAVMRRQLIPRGRIDLPLPWSVVALRRNQNPFPGERVEAPMGRARRTIWIDMHGHRRRRAFELRHRWTRAFPPRASFSTSASVAEEVSPGVVITRAPCAAPSSTASCRSPCSSIP
jgi:hypothetical protein